MFFRLTISVIKYPQDVQTSAKCLTLEYYKTKDALKAQSPKFDLRNN